MAISHKPLILLFQLKTVYTRSSISPSHMIGRDLHKFTTQWKFSHVPYQLLMFTVLLVVASVIYMVNVPNQSSIHLYSG